MHGISVGPVPAWAARKSPGNTYQPGNNTTSGDAFQGAFRTTQAMRDFARTEAQNIINTGFKTNPGFVIP
ncbi:hypothetical protein ACN28S_60685 [Cystobacter fuscus]